MIFNNLYGNRVLRFNVVIKKAFPLLGCILTILACSNPINQISDSTRKNFKIQDFVINEPISILSDNGIYHFFFINANSQKIHHAISKNLINWELKDHIKLSDESHLKVGFVIDSLNSAGYKTSEIWPFVALLLIPGGDSKYLPSIAFSNDYGTTWTKSNRKTNLPEALLNYPQNVNIFWHFQTKKWLMTVTLPNHVEFYSSADLHNWEFESLFGIDFFPDNIQWKNTTIFPFNDELHWCFLIDLGDKMTFESLETVYFIGSFNGHEFHSLSDELHWLDFGKNVTGSLITKAEDHRRISIGWKYQEENRMIPIFPRELSLINTNGNLLLSMRPISELNNLRTKQKIITPLEINYKSGDTLLYSDLKLPVEIILKYKTVGMEKGSFPKRFGLCIWNDTEKLNLGYDRIGYYFMDRASPTSNYVENLSKMSYYHSDSSLTMHFLVEKSLIQFFVENGQMVLTEDFSQWEKTTKISLKAEKGDIYLIEGRINELSGQ